MVEVVVREQHRVDPRQFFLSVIVGAKNRFGPAHCTGDARSSHTGSISTRTPSISTSVDECPNHVTRSPLAGALVYTAASVRNGPSGFFGVSRFFLLKSICGSAFERAIFRPPTVVGTGFKNFAARFSNVVVRPRQHSS